MRRQTDSVLEGKRLIQTKLKIKTGIDCKNYVVPGIQWNRDVAPCICGAFYPWPDGNGKDDAPGCLLLGICADECAFRATLEHDFRNVPKTDRRQGKTTGCYMDFTNDGSLACCVWVVSLWQKGK